MLMSNNDIMFLLSYNLKILTHEASSSEVTVRTIIKKEIYQMSDWNKNVERITLGNICRQAVKERAKHEGRWTYGRWLKKEQSDEERMRKKIDA